MQRKLISSKSTFEEKIGYSRAVVQGNWVFVSGTTGYNYESMTISDAVEAQTEQCFLNIKRKYLGTIKPAATMFSAGLADKKMKIEIQVTALKA